MALTLVPLLPWTDRGGRFSLLKLTVFLALLLPGVWLAWLAATDALGPEPILGAMRESGRDALRVLLLSLFVTPLRQMLRWPRLAEVRRMVGLFALAYALVHLVLFVAHQNWRVLHALGEIAQRFYLSLGFAAVLGLVVLGATSTDGMVKRMGGRAWRRLHRVVFAVAALGLWHFLLHSKSDITEPVLTAGLFLWLALYRVVAPEGGGPRFWALLAISAASALATAMGETAWYAVKTGVDASMVFAANLDFEFGLRPAWWVLLAGLTTLLTREVAKLIPRQTQARRRPSRES